MKVIKKRIELIVAYSTKTFVGFRVICSGRFGRKGGVSQRCWLNYFCECHSFGGKTAILTALPREASAECQTLLALTIPSATLTTLAGVMGGGTCVFFICSGERVGGNLFTLSCATIERFSYDLDIKTREQNRNKKRT